MTHPYDDLDYAQTLRSGEQPMLINRYRIVRELGRGGMGSVYLAEDTHLDGRLVAIKMPSAILAQNKRAVADLKREATTAMELSHPAIVTLRSFEQPPEGVFLVMDYIAGQTLEDKIAEQGTLTPEEVVALLKPVAEALDYAHEKKVIHRDLKPANIMIDEQGKAYLTDFGIAREMKDTLTRVTGRQDTSGTLPYMSPEQVNGENPTPAQDIYSFGALIYECIAGHPPFYRGQIEHQILNKTPDTEALGSGADSLLREAVMRCLAKKPALRPGKARAVFEDSTGRAKLPLSREHLAPPGSAGASPSQPVSSQPTPRPLPKPIPPSDRPSPLRMKKSGVRVGAWLVGFLVIALFVALLAWLFLMQPQRFDTPAHELAADTAEVDDAPRVAVDPPLQSEVPDDNEVAEDDPVDEVTLGNGNANQETIPEQIEAISPNVNPSAGHSYTVQPGDLLTSIADEMYGDSEKWVDIAQANPTVDPTRLIVGTVLHIPEIQSAGEGRSGIGDQVGGQQTYTIKPGDNLSRIADQVYGDSEEWLRIYEHNRDLIGPNPSRMQAGMVLVIPPHSDISEQSGSSEEDEGVDDTHLSPAGDSEESQSDLRAPDEGVGMQDEVDLPDKPDVEVETPARSEELKTLELELLPYFQVPIADRPLDYMATEYQNLLDGGDLPQVDEQIIAVRLRTITRQKEILAAMQRVEGAESAPPGTEESPEDASANPADYQAIGVLQLSSVYDGNNLPRLYRIVDASGRTIAYVSPTEEIDNANLVGTLVGVQGEVNHDSVLKLDIVSSSAVEPLRDPDAPSSNQTGVAPTEEDQAVVDRLYRDKVTAVRRSRDTEDDRLLAQEILTSAEQFSDAPGVRKLLLDLAASLSHDNSLPNTDP